MSLSWNEVRDRAIKFTRQWAGETSERAEAKTFWDQFFEVFGIQRRTVASFEEPFPRDRQRVEYLFALYEQLTAPLAAQTKPKRLRKGSNP